MGRRRKMKSEPKQAPPEKRSFLISFIKTTRIFGLFLKPTFFKTKQTRLLVQLGIFLFSAFFCYIVYLVMPGAIEDEGTFGIFPIVCYVSFFIFIMTDIRAFFVILAILFKNYKEL